MMKAVEMDNEAVEAGKPALTKLKMLNEVVDMLTKYKDILCSVINLNIYILGGTSMRSSLTMTSL